ncbi:MAG: hypothetical protein ACJ8GN_19060 [Longimicrobiaceae bacterium]
MFYVALVPALLMSAYMIVRLRDLEKHDIVLYRFCEIRRGFMRLLRERGSTLSRHDYVAVRTLVDVINTMIHNYRSHKRLMFNGREFLRYLREYRVTSATVGQLGDIEDVEIQRLRDETGKTMVYGFFKYTPFFASQVAILAVSLLAKLGWRRMRTAAGVLTSARATAEQQAEQFGYAT